MRYRRFGRTNIQMPLITCGGMRYQHKWDDIEWKDVPREGQQNIENIIAYVHEKGVRHIETARGYGSSEMQIGPILAQYDRDDWILQTKIAPDADPKVFLENFEKSMAYLQVEYLDLLGFHGINDDETFEQTTRKGGCLDVARMLQKEGRVRHVGFSSHGSNENILQTIKTDEFDYVNLHWYFINELNWPSIEEATRRDMGVFIISPNDKGGKLYDPTDALVEHCQPLHPMAFNNLFCWSKPEVHTLSMGLSRPEDLDLHLEALSQLDDCELMIQGIERRLRARIASETGINWELGWDTGIPRWENVPDDIHTREIIRLWMFAKSFDMLDFARMRYNLLGQAKHWFPGQSVSDFLDSEMIKLHHKCRFADRVPDILRDAHRLLNAEKVKRQSEAEE